MRSSGCFTVRSPLSEYWFHVHVAALRIWSPRRRLHVEDSVSNPAVLNGNSPDNANTYGTSMLANEDVLARALDDPHISPLHGTCDELALHGAALSLGLRSASLGKLAPALLSKLQDNALEDSAGQALPRSFAIMTNLKARMDESCMLHHPLHGRALSGHHASKLGFKTKLERT